MRAKSLDRIVLTGHHRRHLIRLARAGTTPQRLAMRARIVLHAAAGADNAVIAARIGICVDTVRKWRRRWAAGPDVGSLDDAKRVGRPPIFTPVEIAQVKAAACQPPDDHNVALARWSCLDLADQAVRAGICASISASTVRRALAQDAIKPWQHRSWIFPRDPDFVAKASRVLDLYARVWDGRPLDDNDYVISADEKTSIQARCRCHPSLPPGKSRTMRVNHDYYRRGAVAYLAAYDVHAAQVFARCEDTTGIDPFTRLVEHVMSREPYASANRVFWVVDNGSSHRGQPAIERLAERFPNAIMVHTPVHASWLNQVEIYFSIIQRKLLTPNDFTDTAVIEKRLHDFETSYNAAARPFRWRFTTSNLAELMERIDQHEQTRNSNYPDQAA
jgi:transposase-like protein